MQLKWRCNLIIDLVSTTTTEKETNYPTRCLETDKTFSSNSLENRKNCPGRVETSLVVGIYPEEHRIRLDDGLQWTANGRLKQANESQAEVARWIIRSRITVS
ncbi:hypothetical protein TNCV_3911551 [Trichonephila clavipes]|nr:hypothetical protein TNCV_3911551 [Trichonephila clavipes]